MKKYLCMLFGTSALMLLTISGSLYALPETPPLSWKCTIHDKNNLVWSNESIFKRKALNTVFDTCKNESLSPRSCIIKNIDCDSFLNGMSTLPIWQCMALDKNAAPWFGDMSTYRDEAALSAKSECARNSVIPTTCYMHMLTCKNRNEVQL